MSMIVPGSVSPMMAALGGDPLDELGVIGHTVRTRASASGYLTRTFGAGGDRTKWTYSRWVKREKFGVQQPIFYVAGTANDTDYLFIQFDSSDRLSVVTGVTYFRSSTRKFRDPSAHFMVTISVDTNQATANNRIRVYIDDEEITTWDAINNPALGANMGVNQVLAHEIGRAEAAYYFDGYNSEIRFINGQQLDPSSFGLRHPKTNQWRPKAYSGAYGTNGFYLDFSDGSAATAAALGADRSGNGNNWTPTNISVAVGVGQDWLLDTPTNNFCTLNSEDKSGAVTLADGNLKITSVGTNINIRATHLIPPTGKWYFESHDIVTGSNNIVGCANAALAITESQQAASGSFSIGMADLAVFGFAINVDAGTWTIYKNNVQQSTGSLTASMRYAIFCATGATGSPSTALNFGQRAFTYAPPSEHLAIGTKNFSQTSSVTVSGTFTGNASADGPCVLMNGTPTTLTINSNAVTFGTHADALAAGFKLRTSSASYNTAGSNTWTATIVSNIKNIFRHQNARGN